MSFLLAQIVLGLVFSYVDPVLLELKQLSTLILWKIKGFFAEA
jgi:hypothetical protein